MILGVVRDLPWGTLVPWAKTARAVYDGRIVLLADPPSDYAPLEAYGVEIFPADLKTEGTCDLCRVRWREIATFLEGVSENVLVTDVRDVIFQRNPLPQIRDQILIGSEIKPHKACPWSTHWIQQVAPQQCEELANEPVLCAGVIGGPVEYMRELARRLYEKTPQMSCGCAGGAAHMLDQAVLNVLFRNGLSALAEISHPHSAWVFHCMGWLGDSRIENGTVVSRSGPPFAILHQYDKVPELAGIAA